MESGEFFDVIHPPLPAHHFPVPTKKMKKKFYLFLCMLVAVYSALFGNWFLSPPERGYAQLTPPNTEELDQKVVTFFRVLEQAGGTTGTAFEEIFRDASLAPRTTSEAVENMSKRFQDLSNSEIGRLRDHEKIGPTKSVGKDVVLLKYLAKHENAPVVWTFTFYRPPARPGSVGSTTTPPTTSGSGWNLILVRFDTNLEME